MIIQSVTMYGVEICGWVEQPEREKVQEAFVKMKMRVSKNTPDYTNGGGGGDGQNKNIKYRVKKNVEI